MRATTLARNELAIALKCAAYNVKRLVWLAGNDAAMGVMRAAGAIATP